MKEKNDIVYINSKFDLDLSNYKKGSFCIVRKELYHRLAMAQTLLPRGYRFVIYKAYNPLEDVDKTKLVVSSIMPDKESWLHAIGGAVDLSIIQGNGKFLDMGNTYGEINKRTVPYYYEIYNENNIAKQNRQILFSVMLQSGFSPSDTEWWHFNYGNEDWAKYYGRPILYRKISRKEVKACESL